ncbi:laminin subunit alpha-3 [Chanos chanos]|uniref:Laminin subunit alpha-3 n=1 Tax=Chanos chanos TaxID=29144 RepID=A0A6J2WS97_CHACN|nr:laminin subunit alpha-3 [Chanos chanos]
MDDELSRLKSELESINNKATAHIDLKKLLDAIAATKVLVSMYSSTVQNRALKVKELDADMENVKEDLSMLKHETNKTFSKAHKVLQKVDHTNDRSQALLSAITDLLRRIQELLDKVKDSINTSAPVAPEEVIRMLKEAQQMLQEMRRQNCRTEWKIAEEEQGKADKLLDYIKKHLADHLDENKTLVDQIAQSLMDALAKLQDLAEALKHAEKLVQQAQQLNEGNEAGLKDILKRRKQLESEQSRIPPDLSMARDTLRETEDLQKMLDDLKKEYEKLAAQLDGARNDVPKKLNELSLATSKEGLVRQAEEHAQSLFNLAMDLQITGVVSVIHYEKDVGSSSNAELRVIEDPSAELWALQNISNNSAVQKASEAVKAYTDVINAIREAKAAAEKATQAADQAVTDVKQQDLAKRTMVLKDAANKLLEEATQAQESLKMAEQNIKTQSDRLNRAKDKSNNLKRDIEALEQKMKKIKRDDIAALLDMAKQDASAANSTVNNVTEWVKNISAELNKTVIPSAGSNLDNILNEINKTLTDLNQSLPTLTDTLAEVKNQSQRMPDSANLQDDIRKIKEMIENTRDMVNRVRGPMLFSGNGHVELRPPKNLEDLKAFTALSLMMQRANTDPSNRRRRQGRQAQNKLFVLYLGNKQSPKDYIGMYLEKDVLYCVFKLGGIIHEIKTNAVTRSATNNAFMDKVDFHRVYQDAEVLFTTAFTSATPQKLPPKTLQSNTTVGLLDLDPDDVVFYVGGYPTDFTPPEEINLPPYRGCIEFSTFNDQILGLYNFKQAVNITDKDKCLRHNIIQPPLRGCVGNLRVGASFQLFVEEVGVIPGCFNSLLGVREGTLDLGSSLFLPAKGVVVNGGLMVSLGFKSTQTNSLILQVGQARPGFQLSLVDGFVEMADAKNALRSNEIYNNGEWHYLTAFRNESGLELTVDNKDMGKQQPGASPVAAAGDDIILGKETFSGCIQNLYTRGPEDQYLPADLSAFIQKGNVTLGVCVASQHLPRRIMTKERKRKRNRNDLSGVIKKAAVKDPKGQCEEPAPLIQAYSLDGVRSQLQYNIDAKDLNYRPHFSLDVRTKSSEGLLLHIFGRRGVCMVALYMANGKVKLMVGRNITISHHRKINNGDWHNIRFSVEKDSTHMLVDGFRVPDGKLAEDEGFSLDLQPPVYIGGGQVQPVLEMQRKSLPHKRVIGCIRDIKFYNALLEPAVNHGVAPCFDGDTEKGAYFAGDRSYVVLEKFFTLGEHFNLAFEIRPRNLMGLLFHAGNQHGHNLTVFMKKGKVGIFIL